MGNSISFGKCCRYFEECITAPHSLKAGVEYEVILMSRASRTQLPYWGTNGIRHLLLELNKRGYQGTYENGLIIGLKDAAVCISLEPGGQLEFSGAPHEKISVVYKELSRFLVLLNSVCQPMGIEILPVGCNPINEACEVELVPTQRYQALMPSLQYKENGSGCQKITASMQVSLDYFSEAHAEKCLRVGLQAQPLMVALCANSPIAGGVYTGWKSYRSKMWMDFPNDRRGIPNFMLDRNTGGIFQAYTAWAFDRQLLYFVRDNTAIQPKKMTFSEFVNYGYRGNEPTISDWHLHLSSLYPEARLKNVIEMRSADTCSALYTAALASFWKGIFYSNEALTAADNLLNFVDPASLLNFYVNCAKQGLDAATDESLKASTLLNELLNISRYGLRAQGGDCCELSYLNTFYLAAGLHDVDLQI